MKTIFSALILNTIFATSMLMAKPLQPAINENPKFNAATLVQKAFRNVSENYSKDDNMMSAFYRESVNKDTNVVSINEAILDISKASYITSKNDKVVIKKARGNNPELKGVDAVMMKLQGGPNSALLIDIVKYPFLGVDVNELNDKYTFAYGLPEKIDNKEYYVVLFNEKCTEQDILFRGKMYIEPKSYAISRVIFSMNVEKRGDAYMSFVKQKPTFMHMDVKQANYVVNYKEYNNKWYFDYSTSEVYFQVKWNKMAINNEYTLKSQLAVTNLITENIKIDKKDLLKPSDFVADKVKDYQDTTNWDVYNLIMLLALK
jgi:hypothetical protein